MTSRMALAGLVIGTGPSQVRSASGTCPGVRPLGDRRSLEEHPVHLALEGSGTPPLDPTELGVELPLERESMAMSSWKWVQLNCPRSACTISACGKTSAKRAMECRFRLLNPRPNSAVRAMAKHNIAAEWTAESLAAHTQAVLQGAFILARAKNDMGVAAESVDHLRRYVELLFSRASETR